MEDELLHPERDRDEPSASAGPSKAKPAPKPKPAPAPVVVRDITQATFNALGLPFTPDGNNLVPMLMPKAGTLRAIKASVFSFGKRDPLDFTTVAGSNGRVGIFAAKKGAAERAVILVLPEDMAPDGVLAIISAPFKQNEKFYRAIGGGDPLSPNVILFTLLSHLSDNHAWASQCFASSKKMAVVYIVRALASPELGPFASDGPFFSEVLTQMQALTNLGFDFGSATAMSFSLGIFDLNVFVKAIAGSVPVTRIVNLDPERATHAFRPKGAAVVEFLSGETGIAPGFELLDEPRWVKEDQFATRKAAGKLKHKKGRLEYFHDRCIAGYCLRLALEKS